MQCQLHTGVDIDNRLQQHKSHVMDASNKESRSYLLRMSDERTFGSLGLKHVTRCH